MADISAQSCQKLRDSGNPKGTRKIWHKGRRNGLWRINAEKMIGGEDM
jgi:hypothetical protein